MLHTNLSLIYTQAICNTKDAHTTQDAILKTRGGEMIGTQCLVRNICVDRTRRSGLFAEWLLRVVICVAVVVFGLWCCRVGRPVFITRLAERESAILRINHTPHSPFTHPRVPPHLQLSDDRHTPIARAPSESNMV